MKIQPAADGTITVSGLTSGDLRLLAEVVQAGADELYYSEEGPGAQMNAALIRLASAFRSTADVKATLSADKSGSDSSALYRFEVA